MKPAMRLSHTILDSLAPEPKRYSIRDTEARGLSVTVTPLGHKSFSWVGRSQGKPCRKTLGDYPTLALDRARKMARRILGDVSEGKPAVVHVIEDTALTLEDVFEWWHRNHATLKTKDPAKIRRMFDNSFAGWRPYAMDELTGAMVQEKHTDIAETRGKFAANEAMKLLRQVINCAIDKLNWRGTNPTNGLHRFERQSRERYLLEDEMPAFFQAVNGLRSPVTRDMVMMCLWTGARRGNVAAMRWSEIVKDVWVIPGDKAKKKKPISVVLVPQALAILTRRRNDNPFVFPSRSKSGHYSWPKAAWASVIARSGLTNLRMHDLRRTLGSWQATAGVSEIIIGKSLGHTSSESTKVYTRMQLAVVRKAVTDATKDIERAATKKNKKGVK